MKVLHLNTHDYGGAARAAFRLHEALIAGGCESQFLVRERTGIIPGVGAVLGDRRPKKIFQRIYTRLNRAFSNRFRPRDPDYAYMGGEEGKSVDADSISAKLSFSPNVIVAHWVSGFVDTENLRRLQSRTGAPIFWYLLDMAPITGGCHYAWQCEGYLSKCGKCPALFSDDENDVSRKNWERKFESISKTELIAVAGSAWNFDQAKRASLFREKRIEKIPVSVDPDLYSPGGRETARARFGIDPAKRVLFFGAYSLGERRKGISHLLGAFRILAAEFPNFSRDTVIIYAGGAEGWAADLERVFVLKNLGYLASEDALRDAYRAADAFVCPSIEDSGPMMINEAMMCGTPVVAFDMGAAPDFVHTGSTGYRARLGDDRDLAEGIRTVLEWSAEKRAAASVACRELASELSAPPVQAAKFIALFESVLEGKVK